MSKVDAPAKAPEAPAILGQTRIDKIAKVTLETPALLNMIKHCQDKTAITGLGTPQQEQFEMGGAQGMIMGVLKKDLDEQYLLVTATVPQSKRPYRSLKQIQDAEKDQAKED